MAEYIEREAAIAVINKLKGPTRSPAQNNMILEALTNMARVPAADVELVRHGTWVLDGSDEYSNHWHCNKCGKEIDTCNEIYTEPAPIRCPQCGAKMGMESDNEKSE